MAWKVWHTSKKQRKVWIQDPETAEVDYMPKHAVEEINFDLIIKPDNLAEYINQL
jgi:two-component system chemotaxis response regulator CheB